jgi:hypothetical protein
LNPPGGLWWPGGADVRGTTTGAERKSSTTKE